ncbi:plastocyanin/azurin family copper-binding protein [Natronosalvus caseinilyticus]|uniref:plastocyanin/azurin family copper-binding protein n=1 Tax=Natronosalvus caseinilyticus TaxID=2953747 RepID=UPI0028B161B8|nr:plastocyanin/azurin family copper-binding protein [Natronosalvus caseinilyticus]
MTYQNDRSGSLRRTFMKAAAATGVAVGAGTAVATQGDALSTDIELDGDRGGWEGTSPDEISGGTNPTLVLEAGTTYTVTWENGDGEPHNFVIVDEEDERLVSTDIMSSRGETQTVEFEATEEMVAYFCAPHRGSMIGDVEIVGGDEGADEAEEAEAEEETDGPDIETVVDISGEPTAENLAVDPDGSLYFSITAGEIRRITATQTQETGLSLDDAELVGELPGDTLGVEVAPDGTSYAAVQSGEETGVWRLPRDAAGTESDDGGETDGEDEADATVATSSHDEFGEILVDSEGMTLYMFDEDEQDAGESACYDDCEENWPPLTAEEEPTAGDDISAELTTFEREDGETQVAANGWPLYYFAQDEEAGDANGQGIGDVWWVLDEAGEPVRETDDEAANGDEAEDNEVEGDEAADAELFAILGVEDEAVPNGIAHDRLRDRLLVTESFGGVVYEIPLDADDPENAASVWFEDDRLSTEMFGVNGLTITPDDDVFLAVTDDEVDGEEAGRIVRVPVEDDGSAGEGETFVEGPEVHGADGLAYHSLDELLYVAAILQSTVVLVSSDGETESVATEDDGLVFCSDVAFGTVPGQCNDLFICNFAPEQPEESAILRWSP